MSTKTEIGRASVALMEAMGTDSIEGAADEALWKLNHLEEQLRAVAENERAGRRDYFAAHAPAVPEWFEPREPKPLLPTIPTLSREPLVSAVREWTWAVREGGLEHIAELLEWIENERDNDRRLDDLVWEVADTDWPKLYDYEERVARWYEDSGEYHEKYASRRAAQWPWYYADLVLQEAESS